MPSEFCKWSESLEEEKKDDPAQQKLTYHFNTTAGYWQVGTEMVIDLKKFSGFSSWMRKSRRNSLSWYICKAALFVVFVFFRTKISMPQNSIDYGNPGKMVICY